MESQLSDHGLLFVLKADGDGLTKGWQTWYTGSGYNTQAGESTSGDSFHETSLNGAQVSLVFYGTLHPRHEELIGAELFYL